MLKKKIGSYSSPLPFFLARQCVRVRIATRCQESFSVEINYMRWVLFNSSFIHLMTKAKDQRMLRDNRLKQREADKLLLISNNPLQRNDHIILKPSRHQWKFHPPIPCDYELALILPVLWKLGFVTTGSDQGSNQGGSNSSAFIIFKLVMLDGRKTLAVLKDLLGPELCQNLLKTKIL